MIGQFPKSSGGGQCPPLRGIDRLLSAAKGIRPADAVTNKPGRPACRRELFVYGATGPKGLTNATADIGGPVYKLDRSPVSASLPTRGTRSPGNCSRASLSAANFALRKRILTKILYVTVTKPGGRC
jgi:hypothetical protein